MTSISGVVIAKNEESNILDCIRSLKEVCDEIIVMDTGSEDQTMAICRAENINLYTCEWAGYSATKNLANSKANGVYILSLDADERLSKPLSDAILEAKNSGLEGVYGFNRKTNYCGQWIKGGGWYPDVKTRLFPKAYATWVGDFVHEELQYSKNLTFNHLNGNLLHYSYKNTKDHLARSHKYSELTAQKLFKSGKKSYFLQPYLSAVVRFFSMFIVKNGWKDGWYGIKIAFISAQSNIYKYKELNRLHKK